MSEHKKCAEIISALTAENAGLREEVERLKSENEWVMKQELSVRVIGDPATVDALLAPFRAVVTAVQAYKDSQDIPHWQVVEDALAHPALGEDMKE